MPTSTYPSNLGRAEHIGSLKRPVDLLEARSKFDDGKLAHDALKKVEDEAIEKEVRKQHDIGIKSVTDGEFRRHMFFDGFHNNLDGMVVIEKPGRELFKFYVPDVKAFFESHAEKPAATMVCESKLERTKPMYRPEFDYLKSIVKPEEVKSIKITLAAPEWYHLRHGEHSYPTSVYPSDAEYFADIAKAYREELADLYEAGCRNVQFDDPLLAYFCSEDMLSGMKAEGIDSEAIFDSYVKLYNDCVRDVPDDMIVGLHLCRGNFKDGMHFSEGGYGAISRKLFNELDIDVFYLEYDTARAGGFEPLADLPKTKSVVLGIISSKLPALESESDLVARLYEAADHIARGSGQTREEALDRVAVSPQCGFASHSEGNRVGYEEVKAKLALTVQVAKKVWSDA